jgi:hypothetical protein
MMSHDEKPAWDVFAAAALNAVLHLPVGSSSTAELAEHNAEAAARFAAKAADILVALRREKFRSQGP